MPSPLLKPFSFIDLLALTVNGTVSGNNAYNNGGGIHNQAAGTINFGSGNLIQNNTTDVDDDSVGIGGGISNEGTINVPPNPNYGSGNWRGTASPVLDNCDGSGCPP